MAGVEKPERRIIRISGEAFEAFSLRGTHMKKKTMDEIMRKVLGLSSKYYPERRKARDFWLLPSQGLSFGRKAEARGEAIQEAIRRGKKRPEAPVKVRELI